MYLDLALDNNILRDVIEKNYIARGYYSLGGMSPNEYRREYEFKNVTLAV